MFKLRTILQLCATSFKLSKCNVRRIVYSSFPDIPTKKETIGETVFSHCDKYSNNIALIDDTRKNNYSYADLKQITKNIASAIIKLGVQPGAMTAIIAQNSPEYIMLMFAISSMGCTVTICNQNFTTEELRYQLRDSKPSIIFTDDTCVEKVSQIASQLQGIKNIYLIGNRKPGYGAVDDLMNDSGNMNPIGQLKLDLENHVALLPYSSGTTGLPKGVMLTHTNIVSNFHQINMAHHIIKNKVLLMFLPLYHIYATIIITAMGFESGSAIVIQPKFDSLSFLNAIEKYKVSLLHLVPPIILFMLNNPNVSKYNLSSIEKIYSAAAPLDAKIETILTEKFQIYYKDFHVYQGYGLTELSPISHLKPDISQLQEMKISKLKLGSVGKLVSNMQCKVVDVVTRKELPVNMNGELLLKGPNVMKGYFGKAKETEQCFETGWFKTGDIGCYDDDEFFYISDRIKELIKVNAMQVAPAELEATLLSINGVGDCAVIGIPHERYGQVPRAFIVKKGEINENQIHDFMKKNLSDYKQLRGGIAFLNEIPKSPSGKILRRLLISK